MTPREDGQSPPGAAPAGYLDMPIREFLAALSEGALSEGALSEGALSEEAQPEEAQPEEAQPEEAQSGARGAAPCPAGGSTAALAVTLAAGLCVMTARLSARHLPHAQDAATQARELRDMAAPLAQADADGYRAVLTAQRRAPRVRAVSGPAEFATAGGEPTDRRAQIDAALAEASEVPLEVARIGAAVAALARRIASEGNPAVRGDAVAAALLAAAGARTAAVLAGINLAGQPDDERPARALRLASEAERAASGAQRAVTATGRATG